MQNSDNFNRALCSAVHTVAQGETLYQIARQYGTDYQRLMMLNGIKNPYNIQPGQKICIPRIINQGGSGGSQPRPPQTPGGSNGSQPRPPARPDDQNRPGDPQPNRPGGTGNTRPPARPDNQNRPGSAILTHTITAGDTLYSLSRRYGVPLSAIMRANPGIDPYNLKIGSTITIPVRDRRETDADDLTDDNDNKKTIDRMDTDTYIDTDIDTDANSNAGTSGSSNGHDDTNVNNNGTDNAVLDALRDIDRVLYEAEDKAERDIEDTITVTAYISDTATDGIIYNITPGESLTSIQAKFGVCLEALKNENPGVDFSGDITGLTICIPYEDRYRKTCSRSFYAVKSDDTINTIAGKTGISADGLLLLNPAYSPEDFSITGNLIRLI